ncbi:MAG: carbamoyltransferase HypF [Anaerolineales bacterium]|nr:carbamoyltransferase HypF [Anaerolineales bacterium]
MVIDVGETRGARIHVQGIVQGVGFRPFVYGLAHRLSVTGWVRNTSAGVDIEIDGTPEALSAFVEALQHEVPPLARIDEIGVEDREPEGFSTFEIVHSETIDLAFQPISPDVSLCADCFREVLDPSDRRFRYPFINCTNCGPRFTIIRDIPYDRPNTTMVTFAMCPDCAEEYNDPLDRRFHAQPVACPICGPHLWLEAQGERLADKEDALHAARDRLINGEIVAIKGLGGFHLACDATNAEAVRVLRRRKLRVDKPFALMMPDLETVETHCFVDDFERTLLASRERPIVILNRRPDSNIAVEVAPHQDTLGVMLPYTPLHVLLMERTEAFPSALVMTSGNLSEEPIATANMDARERLEDLADSFLMHDRDIYTRNDDSVVRAFEVEIYPLRRARGYAPFPVRLGWKSPCLLAVGGELKNTFCLTRERYAFLSHHIGDMENYETLQAFEDGVRHYERLFRVQPEALAFDLHPDYMATRFALQRADMEGWPAVGVQHHHAHIAACMAEHGLTDEQPVIGVSFDGTGYGEDGAIWGGEFLLANYTNYRREFHLAYVPMPGGDAAVREPWRLALAWLAQAGIAWEDDLPPIQTSTREARETLRRMLQAGLNTPLTSSMGRLFDAVSSLAGVRQEVNYEAQAAVELEAKVEVGEEYAYEFSVLEGLVDPLPVVQSVVADIRSGVPTGRIAARFHNSVAAMVVHVSKRIRAMQGLAQVVLSGGVWQNMVLLDRTVPLLRKAGFEVFLHRQVPANDGGLALGQAAIAAHRLASGAQLEDVVSSA